MKKTLLSFLLTCSFVTSISADTNVDFNVSQNNISDESTSQKSLNSEWIEIDPTLPKTDKINIKTNFTSRVFDQTRRLVEPLNDSMVVALCINGGGIRGVIPSVVLSGIELLLDEYENNDTKHYISDYVDFVSGVSVGSIIASLISISDSEEVSEYRSSDVYKLLRDKGKTIFSRRCLLKCPAVFSSIYPNEPLKNIIDEELEKSGAYYLSDIKKVNFLVPSYDVFNKEIVLFKNWKARELSEYNYYLRDVMMSSSAAPIFFPSYDIENLIGKNDSKHVERVMVDGGMCQNNPSQMIYNSMHKFYKDKDFTIISLGTGEKKESAKKNIGKGGVVQWGIEIINVFMDSDENNIDYGLKEDVLDDNYIMLRPKLNLASSAMDDASEENIHNLALDACEYCMDNFNVMSNLAKFLLRNKDPLKFNDSYEFKELDDQSFIGKLKEELEI